MDALILPLSEFTQEQIKQFRLMKTVSRKSVGSEWWVTFRQEAETPIIPFYQNDRIMLTRWAGVRPKSLIEDGTILTRSEPKPVEIPALYGLRKGIMFKVAPFRMRGVIVPGIDRTSQIYILTKPSSDYFREMTKSEFEPIYNGTHLYHNALA